MTTLTSPVIDRQRLPVPSSPREPAPRGALFSADEVGWLEVEASSRLGAAGRPLTALRPHEPTPLGKLARDPRLLDLATRLAGSARVLVAIELGRAADLRHRQLGDTTLFVELGGPVRGQPGTVHGSLDDVPSSTMTLAVGFNCSWAEARRGAPARQQLEDLWPPAAVVAG